MATSRRPSRWDPATASSCCHPKLRLSLTHARLHGHGTVHRERLSCDACLRHDSSMASVTLAFVPLLRPQPASHLCQLLLLRRADTVRRMHGGECHEGVRENATFRVTDEWVPLGVSLTCVSH
jgi:hypothetical protein